MKRLVLVAAQLAAGLSLLWSGAAVAQDEEDPPECTGCMRAIQQQVRNAERDIKADVAGVKQDLAAAAATLATVEATTSRIEQQPTSGSGKRSTLIVDGLPELVSPVWNNYDRRSGRPTTPDEAATKACNLLGYTQGMALVVRTQSGSLGNVSAGSPEAAINLSTGDRMSANGTRGFVTHYACMD